MLRRSRTIPTIVASETAMLVIDLQKAFCDEDGLIFIPNARRIVPNILDAIRRLRRHKIQIIWVRSFHDEGARSIYRDLWPEHYDTSGIAVLSKGTPQQALTEDVQRNVMVDDLIIDKPLYSAFVGTDLEAVLVSLGIKNVMVAGVATNVCVESSVRDAFHRGFSPILLSGCSATFSPDLQATSEGIIATCFGYVMEVADVFLSLEAGMAGSMSKKSTDLRSSPRPPDY